MEYMYMYYLWHISYRAHYSNWPAWNVWPIWDSLGCPSYLHIMYVQLQWHRSEVKQCQTSTQFYNYKVVFMKGSFSRFQWAMGALCGWSPWHRVLRSGLHASERAPSVVDMWPLRPVTMAHPIVEANDANDGGLVGPSPTFLTPSTRDSTQLNE